jgi:hypothetical protein
MTRMWGPTRESPVLRARVARSVPPSRPVPAAEPAADPPAAPPMPGLGARQAELVAALVAGDTLPAGFDEDRLDATRRALLRKRAAEAAKVWPLLAASLGSAWPGAFAEHHRGREPVAALREGWDLARTLHRRGELGAGATGELAEREAALRYDGHSDPRPRPRMRLRRVLATLPTGYRISGRRPR